MGMPLWVSTTIKCNRACCVVSGSGYMSFSQRSTSLRSLIELSAIGCPPLCPVGRPLLECMGKDRCRPQVAAGIGEKRCINSVRLKVVVYQQRLGHRRLSDRRRGPRNHTPRVRLARRERTRQAMSNHPTILQGRSPYRPEKWKKKL